MAWLENMSPRQDLRSRERGIEDLLLALFGGVADKEHERWLKMSRQAGGAEPPSVNPMHARAQAAIAGEGAATGPTTVMPITPTIGSPIDGSSDFIDPEVTPAAPFREPWEVEHERNFANFQAMNPNLDWDAVAAQAGGNVPGGSFSVASRGDVPYEQTDEAFYDFVKNDLPRYEAERMLDHRSRAYNPDAAAMLYDRLAQMEEQPAKDIYAAAQQMHGQAALGQVELAKRQMMLQNSPAGRATVLVDSLLKNIDTTVNPEVTRKLIQAKVMISQGEVDNAMLLLQSLTDDATNAGVPTVDAEGIRR